MAAATRWILYFASKRRTCKEQLALGAVAYESIAMRKAHWSSCIGMVGRNTTAGMPPFSFAPLPQICPLQGRSTKSGPICSVARQPEPAADRVNPLPRPANIASGAKLTGVFLWYRPFVRRAFW